MKKKKGRKSGALPQNRKNQKKPKRLSFSDIGGIIIIFLAVFLLLSLISYDSSDPTWATSTLAGETIHNYGGRVGASLAETFFLAFGLLAYTIPFLLGYLGFLGIFSRDRKPGLSKVAGGGLLFLVLATLLTLLFPRLEWRGAVLPAGGLLGDILAHFLVRFLSPVGSFILLFTILFLLLVFATGTSPAKIIHFIAGLFRFASKRIRVKVIQYKKHKEKERERKAILEKYRQPEEKPREERESEKYSRTAPGRPRDPVIVRPPASPPPPTQLRLPQVDKKGGYEFPPLSLLDAGQPSEQIDKDEIVEKKKRIEEKLREFRVEGEVRECHPGPVITTYEFYPYPGIKVSQVASLAEDLSLALGAEAVRIQRIPGKSSLGIEIPNNKREVIKLRDILQSEKFVHSPSKLTFALGKTVHDEVYVTDLAIMPHLLIAGATGSGKSVALNALIASILYKASPEEVKFILIDPKRLEFSLYDGIPHLMSPVITDPKKASSVLMDAIRKMEERYHKLHSLKVRSIEQYNQQVKIILDEQKGKLTDEEKERLRPLPYIIILIDELAELMMVGAQDVEYCITRLAQLARAVGIHLVMATQRPSIDVITGTIKNNFSSRIAFRVPSKVDSRIILDSSGADKLLGLGDMLFMPPNYPRIIRLHCAFISIPEVRRLVKFAKEQGPPVYDEKIVRVIKGSGDYPWGESDEKDELFDKALELVLVTGQASASYLQRRLKLGYARAARIIDQMEHDGILGPSEGSKPREILVNPATYLEDKTGQGKKE